MKITEAYIMNNINEEQFVGCVQPVEKIVKRAWIPEIWGSSYYNSSAPKEQKAYDIVAN